MEITIRIDDDELEKMAQLYLIDDKENKEQIIEAIHDLIYQKYEIETR